MRLYFLSGGKLDVDRAVIHPGDDSHRHLILPVWQTLIQNEGRSILVDTGCPLCAAGDSEALKREYDIDPGWIRPLIARHERPDAQLQLLGLKPTDLDLVVNTHFHFDHAGGNELFPGIPIAVQEE